MSEELEKIDYKKFGDEVRELKDLASKISLRVWDLERLDPNYQPPSENNFRSFSKIFRDLFYEPRQISYHKDPRVQEKLNVIWKIPGLGVRIKYNFGPPRYHEIYMINHDQTIERKIGIAKSQEELLRTIETICNFYSAYIDLVIKK